MVYTYLIPYKYYFIYIFLYISYISKNFSTDIKF